MRPKGTVEQLAARRAQALKLLIEGRGPTEIGRLLGVSRQAIYFWKADARRKRRRRSKRKPGGVCRLTAQQQKKLARELLKGAYVHGYPDDHWTLDRIARVIFDLFGVRYHPSSVWYLLRRMKWSHQQPQRVPVERDDEEVERWLTTELPKVKKVAGP